VKWRWSILAVIVIVALTALTLYLNYGRGQPAIPTSATPSIKPVVAQAGVVPAVQQKLGFSIAGRVKAIKVAVGDKVKAGDTLATLDTADLELKVQDAETNLALQKALVAQSAEPPSQADLTAAQAALASAQAKAQLTASGANPDDLKAAQEAVSVAQAGVANAQAQLTKATAPPTASDIAAAEASVRSAQAQVASAKQKLSDLQAQPLAADVTAARLAVDQAKNTLWSQQLTRDATCGPFGPNSPQCKSADASVAAANTGVQTAQASLVKAQQPATPDQLAAAQSGIDSANAALASAQEQLAKVKAGPTSADRDAAQAQVDQAKANLRSAQAKLDQTQAGSTDADRQAAQSEVEQARASLAKLTAPPSPATVDVSTAKLRQAQVTVDESQQALKEAVIVAPFDGEVTSLTLQNGDVAEAGATVLTIADLGTLRFETNDLDEVSAAKVHVGQIARVTVPALDKRTLTGRVAEIAREPTITASGDVNYVAKIALDTIPPDLRWGQTARVEFAQ
jgi:HlyD family secretion protein